MTFPLSATFLSGRLTEVASATRIDTAMSEQEPESLQIPLSWVDLDETRIEFANQFIVQHQPEEFILTVGQLAPPPLLGTREEQREQAANLSFVPIQTLGRYGLTRHRLVELIQLLQSNLETFDKKQQAQWGQP